MKVALSRRNFTDFAMTAGFTDSAHVAHSFHETLGVTPSYVFRNIVRAGAMPGSRFAARK
jgi:transcriptional regulator GlxA family with amidase domain